MPNLKIQSGNIRAEVHRTISDNYAVMCIHANGGLERAGCNFISRDEAATEALRWVLAQPGLVWEPAKVGCYWSAEDFTISTYRSGCDGAQESGYALTRARVEVGRYATLDAAQEAAEGIA